MNLPGGLTGGSPRRAPISADLRFADADYHPMMPGDGYRSVRRRLLIAATILVLAAVAAAPAVAAAGRPAPLSPRLVVLSSPQVRSLAPSKQARRVGLIPSGAGSLLRRGRRVVLDVRFATGAASSVEALREAGAEIVDVSSRYQTVTVAALPAQLRAVAAVPGVEGVEEEITPFLAASCPQGSVVSEGDRQLEAARARNDFAVDGSGVTVGIISDSVNQWKGAPASEASDVATGDLPGTANPCGQERPVKVLTPFIPGAYPEPGEEPENAPPIRGTDEGRAMLQIVHDIAPGADLDFASGVNGELAFAKAIRDLYAAGSQVIADDVYYFDEPFYQDGPIAVAVNEVASKGVDYFSAAGNNNLINGQGEDIASWEAPAYRETGCPAALPAYYDSCMNFAPHAGEEDDTFGIHLEEGSPLFLDLQWAQPWNGVTTDLDMFVLNEKGEIVEQAFNEPNTEPARQKPYEFVARETGAEEEGGEEVEVVIARCDEACGQGRAGEEIEGQFPYAGTKGGDDGTPRLKLAIVNNGGGVDETEYPPAAVEGSPDLVGPTIFGHTAASGATSVAAMSVTHGEEPESYSSRGPAVHLFGPVDGTGAAPPTGEVVIAKPNVTASDCGATTFFNRFEGTFYFCGTSAAAPHAAGIAALVRSANPGVSNSQLRAVLESTAVPIGPAGQPLFGPKAIGAGLLDAESAVSALALPPSVRILNPPAAASNVARPSIDFAANRYAGFSCALDGGPAAPCRSPFVSAAPLADGPHTFVVTATDLAGRSGRASAQFTIDTKAPVARFAKRPKKVVKTHGKSVKLGFRLAASEPGSVFRCKVDGGGFHRCGPGLAKRFRLGRHIVRAQATDQVGNVGRPAVFRFRVERIQPHGRHGKRHAHRRDPSS